MLFFFLSFFSEYIFIKYITKGTLDNNNIFVQFNICIQIKIVLGHYVVKKINT